MPHVPLFLVQAPELHAPPLGAGLQEEASGNLGTDRLPLLSRERILDPDTWRVMQKENQTQWTAWREESASLTVLRLKNPRSRCEWVGHHRRHLQVSGVSFLVSSPDPSSVRPYSVGVGEWYIPCAWAMQYRLWPEEGSRSPWSWSYRQLLSLPVRDSGNPTPVLCKSNPPSWPQPPLCKNIGHISRRPC